MQRGKDKLFDRDGGRIGRKPGNPTGEGFCEVPTKPTKKEIRGITKERAIPSQKER